MYVPAWPGLSPGHFIRPPSAQEPPFPLQAPNKTYFYRARNAIYHLFRTLRIQHGETVLVPAYHSGNEVWAMRAAGASTRFYSIHRNLEPDLDELARLAKSENARALFVIHFLGWPQPMKELAALCRERGMILIEDCALSLLSQPGGQPLGSWGDYAIFCLYKTLPVPNGGLLVQNGPVAGPLTALELKSCGLASVAGRIAELMLEWMRSRSDGAGAMLTGLKRLVGRTLSALRLERLPVGDIGFDPASVNVGMSPLGLALLKRCDYEEIRRRRRNNFLFLYQQLGGKVAVLREELEEGVCPLFFPLLVPDKAAAARALWDRGITAVEFWNSGDPEATRDAFPEAHFLRDHVLELPIHQDITPSQLEYMADQVLSLKRLV